MKVILKQDIKGKGKKDEIKDFPAGFANFLIKNNQAVQATDTNIDLLAERKAEEARLEAEHLAAMKELKGVIEAHKFEIVVNVNKEGRVLGTITTKIICEAVERDLNVKLDKRKITFNLLANALGEYKASIQLHREVTATINFILVTKAK